MHNRVALVTGASRGLGKQVALYFGRLGCNVICTARSEALLAETVQAIEHSGGTAIAVAADVTKQAQVENLVERGVERFGTMDILCNCVGMLGPKIDLIEYLDESDWDTCIAVNLKSVFLMCRSVVPLMKNQRNGKIINLTTNIDDRVERGVIPYYAAKAGVTYFTRNLACELKRFNVQVNCLNPGGLKTDMTTFWEQYPDREAMARRGQTQYVPFEDRLREIAEILPIIGFLAGPESDPITGAYFTVSSKVEPMYLSL